MESPSAFSNCKAASRYSSYYLRSFIFSGSPVVTKDLEMHPTPPYRFLRPPSPTFTEQSINDVAGMVVLVTGATSGVGLELCKMLYRCHASVYLSGRCNQKLLKARNEILQECGRTFGRLRLLKMDLTDFDSIRVAAHELLAREYRLDILVHNAGVMRPPPSSQTFSTHDLEMRTNCLGPFLLNNLLLSRLIETGAHRWRNRQNAARILWVSSTLALKCPETGMDMDLRTGQPAILEDRNANHVQTKIGNLYLASEASRRFSDFNVINVAVDPGFVKSELFRHTSSLRRRFSRLFFKPARFGAYTELYACLSDEITPGRHGCCFVAPWGRIGPVPSNLVCGLLHERNGGSGKARRFWEWCQNETSNYRRFA